MAGLQFTPLSTQGQLTSASTNAINIDSTSINNGTSNVSVALTVKPQLAFTKQALQVPNLMVAFCCLHMHGGLLTMLTATLIDIGWNTLSLVTQSHTSRCHLLKISASIADPNDTMLAVQIR